MFDSKISPVTPTITRTGDSEETGVHDNKRGMRKVRSVRSEERL